MPGSGGLAAQQPAAIIGRDAGLARLRGLVDPVPRSSQVLLVTGEAGMEIGRASCRERVCLAV